MKSAERVLIYRLGSLGDTVVALPCFHLIAKAFPNAQRRVLTARPMNPKAPRVMDVIGGSGLIDDCLYYEANVSRIKVLRRLRGLIAEWRPDVLVYLLEARNLATYVRDFVFFRACGISEIIGIPWTTGVLHERDGAPQLSAHQALILADRLTNLGHIDLSDPRNWSIGLSESELSAAKHALSKLATHERLIACSIGTKIDTNDWGLENWVQLARELQQAVGNAALVMVGAPDELEASSKVLASWNGPGLNFCGVLSLRQSAALLTYVDVFIGHDSGPIHLAASVGTPCVGIYSARNPPGEWFPFGDRHRVLYHRTPCYGCKLIHCVKYDKKCIKSITVTEVLREVAGLLALPPTKAAVADSRTVPIARVP